MADDDDRLRAGLAPMWPAPEPGDDFAARVVSRLGEPDAAASGSRIAAVPEPRRPWRTAAVIAVSLAVGAAAAVIVIGRRGGEGGGGAGGAAQGREIKGTLAASEVSTVQLGRRAVVVAHPGTVLAWTVAADGTADVHQGGGEAFFRVEPGGRFEVHTPSGVVHVVGTCFTVTVTPAVTTVDVHEGKVELRDRATTVALLPGERGHLGGDAPARRRPAPSGSSAPPHAVAGRPTTPAPATRGDQCYCMSDPRHLEADQALRDEWASSCRVRADLPPLVEEGDTAASDEAAGLLGLAGDERRTFQAVAEDTSRAALARVREIYTAATGDSAGSLAVEDLLEQIDATRTLGEDAHLRAALSKERAGRATPVLDPSRMTPYEELYRLLVSAGDDFERRLAERLGATRARELRLRFGGWPGPDFDWLGCPPP